MTISVFKVKAVRESKNNFPKVMVDSEPKIRSPPLNLMPFPQSQAGSESSFDSQKRETGLSNGLWPFPQNYQKNL